MGQKILITGDIMQHDKQHEYLSKISSDNVENVASKLFDKDLIDLLQSAESVIGNLETLIDDSKPLTGYPCFNSNSNFLSILKHLNFTDLIVSNNHSKDLTYGSWLKTIFAIEGFGIKAHGHQGSRYRSLRNEESIILRCGAEKFNKDFDDLLKISSFEKMFGYSVSTLKDVYDSMNKVSMTKDSNKAYINYIHSGQEYFEGMNLEQHLIYQKIQTVKSKRDLATILCHSHVIGEVFNRVNGTMQFESGLGNFCSMQKNLNRQLGAIIEYDYDRYYKTMTFVKQHLVETFENASGEIKTILL